MGAGPLSKVVEHLRSVLAKPDDSGLADHNLLNRYVKQRDEAAFEALVRKHGPMVMGVCRRVLRNSHDAEDAFQATFLVLVRRACTLRSPGLLGNWLYGVAYRTALEAKRMAAKRRAKEAQVVPQETPGDSWAELRPLLDQELERLAEKYRAVLVLCDLEGKTRKEAALDLGWPEGTVASRLAAARTMLGKRLARRGVVASGSVLTAILIHNASACVPDSVRDSTIKAASLFAAGKTAAAGLVSGKVATLTEGVLKAMMLTKLKMVTVGLLLLGLIAFGGALLTRDKVAAQDKTDARQEAAKKDDPNKSSAKDPRDAAACPHDFSKLQRLASVLRDFKYPEEDAASSIIIWTDSGGKGGSWQTLDAKTVNLAKALNGVFATWDGFDLENVVIIRAGDRAIQFVDVKDPVASGKPSAESLARGDLVMVLKARKR